MTNCPAEALSAAQIEKTTLPLRLGKMGEKKPARRPVSLLARRITWREQREQPGQQRRREQRREREVQLRQRVRQERQVQQEQLRQQERAERLQEQLLFCHRRSEKRRAERRAGRSISFGSSLKVDQQSSQSVKKGQKACTFQPIGWILAKKLDHARGTIGKGRFRR